MQPALAQNTLYTQYQLIQPVYVPPYLHDSFTSACAYNIMLSSLGMKTIYTSLVNLQLVYYVYTCHVYTCHVCTCHVCTCHVASFPDPPPPAQGGRARERGYMSRMHVSHMHMSRMYMSHLHRRRSITRILELCSPVSLHQLLLTCLSA